MNLGALSLSPQALQDLLAKLNDDEAGWVKGLLSTVTAAEDHAETVASVLLMQADGLLTKQREALASDLAKFLDGALAALSEFRDETITKISGLSIGVK